MTVSVEFEARTARGVLIQTFADRRLALVWWDDRSHAFPGCTLEEVTTQTIVSRRAVRRPRLELVRAS